LFEAIILSGNWKPLEDGSYFIDRNPELFPVIINYLRTGKVIWSKYNNEVIQELKGEIEYYCGEFEFRSFPTSDLFQP